MTDMTDSIEAALESSGVEYEIFPCDPELADTAVFCERYGYPLSLSANTILVKAKTGGERYVVCVVLADTRLDVNRTVRKRLGARRVSFASAGETRAVTGMEIGGVTPIALPEDLEVWVDARIMLANGSSSAAATGPTRSRWRPRSSNGCPPPPWSRASHSTRRPERDACIRTVPARLVDAHRTDGERAPGLRATRSFAAWVVASDPHARHRLAAATAVRCGASARADFDGSPTMTRKLYIRTFGCQMNEYDSARTADLLAASHGLERTVRPEDADVLLVNTCSVREKAAEKVFSEIGRWRAWKEARPDLVIGVGGCVASQEGAAIRERAPYVDVVYGPQTLHRLPGDDRPADARAARRWTSRSPRSRSSTGCPSPGPKAPPRSSR